MQMIYKKIVFLVLGPKQGLITIVCFDPSPLVHLPFCFLKEHLPFSCRLIVRVCMYSGDGGMDDHGRRTKINNGVDVVAAKIYLQVSCAIQSYPLRITHTRLPLI